ncbi:hypothetical protein JQN58_34920 [Aneurinibacillus sp. BA2021]|nr:hypothetical protein [Aneurinibacillus sp. BA2021]
MTLTFHDSDGVTIRETDSEHLIDVGTRIKALRDSNKAASSEHGRAIQNINSDPALSDQGKKERIDELERDRDVQRKASIAAEKEIIKNKISEIERRLDGYVGYTSDNIMAFRDAQDRAENISDAEKAATVMARALRTNDRTLAHAVFRRAVENRWEEARRAFANENPTVAQLVGDIQKLNALHENSFNRAVAYM